MKSAKSVFILSPKKQQQLTTVHIVEEPTCPSPLESYTKVPKEDHSVCVKIQQPWMYLQQKKGPAFALQGSSCGCFYSLATGQGLADLSSLYVWIVTACAALGQLNI